MAAGGLSFDLLEQLTFYGAYHAHPANKGEGGPAASYYRDDSSVQQHCGSALAAAGQNYRHAHHHQTTTHRPPPKHRPLQVIHFVFVPAILWSALVWLAAAGPLAATPKALAALAAARLPPWLAAGVAADGALLAAAAYAAFYVALDAPAGLSWGALVGLPLAVTATAFNAALGAAAAAKWALGVHALGWFMQIVPGHGYFEGRKPALLDSLVQVCGVFFGGGGGGGDKQRIAWHHKPTRAHTAAPCTPPPNPLPPKNKAFALAPLFVWLEALFLLGYRPALRAQLEKRVAAAVAQHKRKQTLRARGGGKA